MIFMIFMIAPGHAARHGPERRALREHARAAGGAARHEDDGEPRHAVVRERAGDRLERLTGPAVAVTPTPAQPLPIAADARLSARY